ncbi:hypothetical protein Skr01_54980 [Sphaerisporangium krabiense]|uniref:Energy-coupling factor transporter ATP-binding protein EcfA2 n=1 Tax=Sphaerisporangium krabiense TaxID=763782 RepID=A0A7W8ZBD0_9ACTN|nr:ATP-binding protein [Sphaerisporangium krabiense]MBB5630903.1 energy-coupling factor transporter ATP-binding protein EcfA2 [Sphaerisporangium krabiense]GII65413.1 hypothetical protein Skr01_54980 [Sphaerisporangium krabiense]
MANQRHGAAPPEHNIAIWGAPGCGKTTFLAALNIALILNDSPWRIFTDDPDSQDFLTDMTTSFQEQRFPPATVTLRHYKWFFSRQPDKQPKGLFRRARPERIGLEVLDAPGGFFGADRAGSGAEREPLLENLERSRGIVYLFDPTREHRKGDAFTYLNTVLTELAGRMISKNRFAGDTLPHYLAVCVTKFDEPRVFMTAQENGLLTPNPEDPYGFPHIDSDNAEELFQELCGVSSSGYAKMVVPTLKKYFWKDHIRFFVTSSIGFYLNPATGRFDPDDYQNRLPDAAPPAPSGRGEPAGAFKIRGPAHPINVIEPMLWLGRQMSADRQGREAG